jgi:hypothetical protein
MMVAVGNVSLLALTVGLFIATISIKKRSR